MFPMVSKKGVDEATVIVLVVEVVEVSIFTPNMVSSEVAFDRLCLDLLEFRWHVAGMPRGLTFCGVLQSRGSSYFLQHLSASPPLLT